ncbi:hypothetical protein DPMN_144733 [Dreissena polymorpha]|uniref:Uncharacterized protein n=1 Tax=Dreissena polymorpha TaxID=45954 RepID=A0A9D4F7C8_DREPO|nr:hypothetical protein DPMN_144733 [Dreissena polymorpha]
MIYVTDSLNGKLLTLTRDGTVTATLQDPAFKMSYFTCNIHVAATGQVFVSDEISVSQVDAKGKTVLNIIKLGMTYPVSVYVNEDTSKMIVGFANNDNIIEFETKVS